MLPPSLSFQQRLGGAVNVFLLVFIVQLNVHFMCTPVMMLRTVIAAYNIFFSFMLYSVETCTRILLHFSFLVVVLFLFFFFLFCIFIKYMSSVNNFFRLYFCSIFAEITLTKLTQYFNNIREHTLF